MKTFLMLAAAGLMAPMFTGCGITGLYTQNNPQVTGLTGSARPDFDGQKLWSRPLETGVDLGEEISGTADHTSILFGLITTGQGQSNPADILAVFAGSIFGKGGGAVTDPLIGSAASNAAQTAKADGIYVTQNDVNESNILFGLYSHRTAHVTGKAMKIKVIGQVTEERADRARTAESLHGANTYVPGDWLGKK